MNICANGERYRNLTADMFEIHTFFGQHSVSISIDLIHVLIAGDREISAQLVDFTPMSDVILS